MSAGRKWQAALTMTLLCGVFWGVAAALGRLGYELIQGGMVLPVNPLQLALIMFLVGGTFGVVGGALFTGGLILFGQGGGRGLTTARAALVGGIAGAGAVLGIVILGFPPPGGISIGVFALASALVFGILGAATGVALLGSARSQDSVGKGAQRDLLP